jgi:hypothetical protein
MDAGQTVYKAYVGDILYDDGIFVSVSEGTVTEIVTNGVPLIRFGRMLQPFDTGWHETREAAMASAASVLRGRLAVVQAQLDRIVEEVAA